MSVCIIDVLKQFIDPTDTRIEENKLWIEAIKQDSINTIALDNIRAIVNDKIDSLKR